MKYFIILIAFFILLLSYNFCFSQEKDEIIEMRRSQLIYDKGGNLIAINVSLISHIGKGEWKDIYIFAKDYKKYIIITRENINYAIDIIEKYDYSEESDYLDRNEYEKELMQAIEKFTEKIELFDGVDYKKYFIFYRDNSICISNDRGIAICDSEMINYISSNLSNEINCLLGFWRDKSNFCKKSEYIFKFEHIDCKDAEGRIDFDCNKWENITPVKNVQWLRGKNKQ